jgi:tetratricopeptide (TPR) repeat protein
MKISKQKLGHLNGLYKTGQYEKLISEIVDSGGVLDDQSQQYLAGAYLNSGQIDKCLDSIRNYEKTHELDTIEWFSHKTIALSKSNKITEAKAELEKAIERFPKYVEFHHNLSVITANEGDWDKSLKHSNISYQLMPNGLEVLVHMGRVLIALKLTEQAKKVFTKLIKLIPNQPDGYNGIGAAYLLEFNIKKSIEYFHKALFKDPNHATTLGNLGVAYKADGQYQKAMENLKKAIYIDPKNTEHNWNQALLQLLTGNYLEGWKNYEWRFHPDRTVIDKVSLPKSNIPMLLNSDSVKGKTVALMAEQGFGDSIQFNRYAQLLRNEGAQVVVMTAEPLMSLMQTLPWANFVCNRWSVCPHLDYWVYPMSLPGRYKTEIESIPKQIPYLFAQESHYQHWKAQLGNKKTKLRVGLVWAGRPIHGNDKNRSMKLEDFAVLASSDVEFISLQIGDRAGEGAPEGMQIIRIGEGLKSFADSAAVLTQLDLLISIDSAPVHLAGALGCPVWVLIPANPDFRWLLDRSDSPWYESSLRVFRQKKLGDWVPVMQEMREALSDLINNPIKRDALVIPDIPFNQEILNEAGALPLLRVAIQLQQKNQTSIAVKIYQFILKYNPNELDAVRNLGIAYRGLGEQLLASQCYEKVLNLDPNDVYAHANFANLLLDMKQIDLAEKHAKRALELGVNTSNPWYSLSVVYQIKHEYTIAGKMIEKALDIEPDNVTYLTMKGLIYKQVNQLDQARLYLDKAHQLNPQHTEAELGLAQLFCEEGQFEKSLASHNSLIEKIKSSSSVRLLAEVMSSRASLLIRMGEFQLAVSDYQDSVNLEPNNADMHFNLGMYQLLIGKFDTGWREYEWRYHSSRQAVDRVKKPVYLSSSSKEKMWEGESLLGKAIILAAEQGNGDNIQFVRYAKFLKAQGANVFLACPSPLAQVMETCTWLDGVICDPQKIPHIDYWTFPLSLPYRFETNLETIPADIPYLSSNVEQRQKWHKKLLEKGLLGKPLIIIVNKGSPGHGNDKNRSVELELFKDIIKNPNFDYIVMDYESRDREQIACGDTNLENIGAHLENFSDSAAVIAFAKLVISVDSAPLHLAGAMGIATFALIPFVPDWRWMLNTNHSPWYPNMHLYRQDDSKNWDSVVSNIENAIKYLSD